MACAPLAASCYHSIHEDRRVLMRRLILLAAAVVLTIVPAQASEQIEISLSEIRLRATLFRPAGAGPFPAVIALHGCEGLKDHAGAIRPQYREWGERLQAMGYAVLFPDSFGSRGHGSQCRIRERPVRASRSRMSDANAARRWVQVQQWSNAERVSLIGWSHGATAALYAIRRRAEIRDGTPDFRSAIAFYPSCKRLGLTAWSGRVPALVLIGKADDWTTAATCEQMVAGARGRSAQVQIRVYPGAYHYFDRSNEPLHQLTGIANTASAGGRVHAGTNLAARNDSIRRVQEFLER
jgi:dienelactone hydrolase